MADGDTIIRFEDVSFGYGPKKPILHEVSFSLRTGAKFALMGQNGAGKTSVFKLMSGFLKPESGAIHSAPELAIATARQVIPRHEMDGTVRAFFEACFLKKVYNIDPRIDAVLDAVNFSSGGPAAIHDRVVRTFSGGEQARLLLASALIQDADLLLLDEPTNNLDSQGIAHLRKFLIDCSKTCIVISHDADFLNAFTEGVLYLDSHTHTIERHVGNYFDVVAQISARIERENRANARLAKTIIEKKEQAGKFAKKGGQMRLVATRMREKAAELEEEKVAVRKEDRVIRSFDIPAEQGLVGEIVHISSFSAVKHHRLVRRQANISLAKKQHLLLVGPNGIGKSTLLRTLAERSAKGTMVARGVRIGYYSQDFSSLNFEETAYDSLASVMPEQDEQTLRSVAAGFLITGELMHIPVSNLSEGQKGLLSFARLKLLQPGLLLLDEPTNHINFRHIPVIAEALTRYEGAMILVSHAEDFVRQIRIDDVLDLGK